LAATFFYLRCLHLGVDWNPFDSGRHRSRHGRRHCGESARARGHF
jgi:hypothetical protein